MKMIESMEKAIAHFKKYVGADNGEFKTSFPPYEGEGLAVRFHYKVKGRTRHCDIIATENEAYIIL